MGEDLREFIYTSCLKLNEKDFDGFLALCAPNFRYTVSTYSPEIKKDMIWLEHDKEEMERLFKTLPKHNSDHSELTRYPTIYSVANGGNEATVVTGLQVYRTELDGGATNLYAVGQITDTVSLEDGTPKLAGRHVRLQTRMLGIGHHVPF